MSPIRGGSGQDAVHVQAHELGPDEDGEHGIFDATAFEPALEDAVARYNDALPAEAPRYEARTLPHGLRQDALSAPLMEAEYAAVEESFNGLPDNERRVNIARLRSCKTAESSAFLTAVREVHRT